MPGVRRIPRIAVGSVGLTQWEATVADSYLRTGNYKESTRQLDTTMPALVSVIFKVKRRFTENTTNQLLWIFILYDWLKIAENRKAWESFIEQGCIEFGRFSGLSVSRSLE